MGFICITGFFVLGGAKVGGKKAAKSYGIQNFNGSFHQQSPTTPYSYAQSLLSVLFSLGGWYVSNLALQLITVLRPNAGKRQIMSESSLFQ